MLMCFSPHCARLTPPRTVPALGAQSRHQAEQQRYIQEVNTRLLPVLTEYTPQQGSVAQRSLQGEGFSLSPCCGAKLAGQRSTEVQFTSRWNCKRGARGEGGRGGEGAKESEGV
jgi:hypothetical protein